MNNKTPSFNVEKWLETEISDVKEKKLLFNIETWLETELQIYAEAPESSDTDEILAEGRYKCVLSLLEQISKWKSKIYR